MEPKFILLLIVLSCILVLLLVRYLVIRKRMKNFQPKYHSKEQVASFNDLLRAAGFAYDPRQNIFYSLQDCWQRKFGYRELFDEMSPTFSMVFQCEPIVFQYEDKQWMIEIWKGQYGINTGAEVGVYIANGENTYRCANNNEELYVRFHLWKGKKLIASREQKGWWTTAFSLGEYAKPKRLSMTIDISLLDFEMAEIFYNELLKMGYSRSSVCIYGSTVRIKYEHPFSKQPFSQTGCFAKFVMLLNRINCALFRYLTRKQICTLDKIEYIKIRLPILYHFMTKVIFAGVK